MTDIDVIEKILKSSKPSDLFTDTEPKKIYIQYSKLIHPDVCSNKSAGEAMAKMNYFKDVIENGTPYVDESGPFRVFEKKIVYVVNDANRKLITKSVDNYKKLMSLHDKASENFKRYLPESMVLEKDCLTINLKDRSIPLTGQKLPQEHVNWLFSRMFEFVLWLRQVNYVHMGLNPTTVFVVPETHGIIVINFYHMSALGKKAETISAKYKMWYPTALFTKKIATPDIDLELSKKLALYLLGDRSAAGTKLKMDKTIHKEVLNFLLTKHQNTKDEFVQYRELLAKNFEKKFYSLHL
ncbi:MAG: hypothetical protein WCJ61_16200 [Paludibacter sp.]